jgi:hypothetical protein
MATKEKRLRAERIQKLRSRFRRSRMTEEQLYAKVDKLINETNGPRFAYLQARAMASTPDLIVDNVQGVGAKKSAASRKLNAALEIAETLGWLK